MKRKELIAITDEYEFRSTLAQAKISDSDKISIIRDRKKYLYNAQRRTTSVPIGPYRDPMTGMLRFNTGR